MNINEDINNLIPNFQDTITLINTISQRYKQFPEIQHSKTVAALVHQVGKELSLIIEEKKSAIELNNILRNRIGELDAKTQQLQIDAQKAETDVATATAKADKAIAEERKKAADEVEATQKVAQTFQSAIASERDRADQIIKDVQSMKDTFQ